MKSAPKSFYYFRLYCWMQRRNWLINDSLLNSWRTFFLLSGTHEHCTFDVCWRSQVVRVINFLYCYHHLYTHFDEVRNFLCMSTGSTYFLRLRQRHRTWAQSCISRTLVCRRESYHNLTTRNRHTLDYWDIKYVEIFRLQHLHLNNQFYCLSLTGEATSHARTYVAVNCTYKLGHDEFLLVL